MAKKDIIKNVQIPEGIELELKDYEITVRSGNKESKMAFKINNLHISKKDNNLEIKSEKINRKQAKMVGSIVAHIQNMIAGMKENYIYKLEICTIHFPVTTKVEGNRFIIKNFLGETMDRGANILKNVDVSIKGNEIIVSSFNKESAGQTAANIEKATKIRGRDRRVFQDGIFLTERCGRKI